MTHRWQTLPLTCPTCGQATKATNRATHQHALDPATIRTAQYKVSPWNHYEQWGSCACGATWSTTGGWS